MRIQRALISWFTAAIVLCCLATPTVAQTGVASPAVVGSPSTAHNAAPVPKGSSLVRVSRCSAIHHDKPGNNLIGYTPGTSGSNMWGDAYGYTYYQPQPLPSNPTLAIDYVNISKQTMHSIEFGYEAQGILIAEARDNGTFASGAEIKHKLGLDLRIFPIPAGITQCVPLRITFADGTKWRNPRLPPKGHGLYLNPKQ